VRQPGQIEVQCKVREKVTDSQRDVLVEEKDSPCDMSSRGTGLNDSLYPIKEKR